MLHQSGRNLSNAKGEGLFLHFTVGSVLPVGNLFFFPVNAQVRIKKKRRFYCNSLFWHGRKADKFREGTELRTIKNRWRGFESVASEKEEVTGQVKSGS